MPDDRHETTRSLPSRRWGPFRQEFYSLHSGPPCASAVNGVCEHGMWLNVHSRRVGALVYRLAPALWRVWANRRWLNPTSRFLERMFPNLRSGQ